MSMIQTTDECITASSIITNTVLHQLICKAKRKGWDSFRKDLWWVEGFPFECEGKTFMLIPNVDGISELNMLSHDQYKFNTTVIEVVSETICRYTGLTDKDRTKIWEHDIVRNYGYDELCIVNQYKGDWIGRYSPQTAFYKYDDRKAVQDDVEENNPLCYINLGFYACEQKNIKRIGNVFDHEEILNKPARLFV